MGILSKDEILKEIKKQNLTISPFNKNNLGAASYDLTLDEEFRIFDLNLKVFNVEENSDYKKLSSFKKTKSIILQPGDFALGITKETINLNSNICGWLSGRSRFARLGIGVHVTSNFVQPGIDNKQVLEIKNLGNTPLKINAGTRIIQIIFERIEGKVSKYKGKFVKQTEI
ncbi:dCTP deaminase [Candidatus Woesearchaeota archaeon]|nr:dCTP deaminase [Candidatus Woesearchaeota archaeon]